MYNLMTGEGFVDGPWSTDWVYAWVGLLIMAVLIMLSKKLLEEEGWLGFPFSFVGGLLGGVIYFLAIVLFGHAAWALILGIIGFGLGGYFGGKYSG